MAAAPPPPDFARERYYLHNFRQALSWIAERSADLLDAREQAFVRDFAALPEPSSALLVRLVMRRGPLFRASRLRYDEIGCPLAAAEPLLALGWLIRDPALTLEQVFALHTRAELARGFAAHGSGAGLRKPDWCLALQGQFDAPRPYSAWPGGQYDTLFELAAAPLCERLRLIFFGNLHQEWSEFVLADLGIFRYESVALAPSSRAFRDRQDVDDCLALHACRQAVDGETPAADLIAQALQVRSGNDWLRARQAKILFRIGERCERHGDWDGALAAYQHSSHPGARHRRLRVLERSGRHADAIALAEQASAAPESEAEQQKLARMLPRLRRALGQAASRRRAAPAIREQTLWLPAPAPGIRVEAAAREHLHSEAAPTVYVENALINSLFGLLCWDAVFAPLPGAFFHPFQRGPADLNEPGFALRRQALFASCLAQLDDGRYADTIRRRYDDKQGLQSPFVAWGLLTPALLDLALGSIPAAHLRRYFERLLADPRGNRNGLPDLIRFDPARARYELIEIKGPGDRLQDNQIRWLHYCAEHGIEASVCHVRWLAEAA